MFNDPNAGEIFRDFQAKYRFNTIIETGTHEGRGAFQCSLYRDTVCTIEVNPQFRLASITNLCASGFHIAGVEWFGPFGSVALSRPDESNRLRTIHSVFGNSAVALDALLASGKFPRPFLFYLDAHWEHYWPLLEELRTIARYALSDSCIIIHDFQVPGKPWGYDSYRGQPLNMDFVREDLFRINPHYHTFYNDRASNDRHGRGILYAVPPGP